MFLTSIIEIYIEFISSQYFLPGRAGTPSPLRKIILLCVHFNKKFRRKKSLLFYMVSADTTQTTCIQGDTSTSSVRNVSGEYKSFSVGEGHLKERQRAEFFFVRPLEDLGPTP